MDINWGDPRLANFITGVGLVRSDGPNGSNVMACEGTHLGSYAPALVTVSVGHAKATWENIVATGEFGVSLASVEQPTAVVVAGRHDGKDVDKVAALKELGVQFRDAEHIRALLVEGAALHAECRGGERVQTGDHTLFVGEVLAMTATGKEPMAYRQGSLSTFVPLARTGEITAVEDVMRKFKRGRVE